ncbi:MAG TPA: SpoIIE family protein phosphatase [Candidatus Limnocylindria bacterium]|nr:SpoIIE family protein phosphatase [Candidatus Limnocylindria bacterium]
MRGISLPLSFSIGYFAFAAAVYFLFRLLPWVRSQLLWRLRNRLIVAYVFIAVVPVVLLLTMAGLAAYGIYLQLGAHLLHDDLNERISMIAADADTIAGAIEQEVPRKTGSFSEESLMARPGVASVITAARMQWPELRVMPNRGEHLVKAGNGRHYAGLVEFERKLWLASAESRTGPSGPITILVGVPLTQTLLDGLTSDLGPIHLILLEPAGRNVPRERGLSIAGESYEIAQQISSKKRALVPAASWLDMRVSGASTFEAARIEPSEDAPPSPVLASFALRPSAVNHKLLTSVGAVGPVLVTVLLIVGVIFLVIELVALITGVVLTRTITRAVGDLYEATLHVRRGDFSYRVRVPKRDQLGVLGESFNEMTSSVQQLIEEQRRRQRLENELSIAREVQEQLFPRSLPSVPGLELAAICRPARTVSGDYYDFISLSPLRLAIALADISGKGISAALLMASLQAALRSQAEIAGHSDPAELVARLNAGMFKNTSDDRYATFFYGVYDAEAKTLTYTNAGHLAPFFVSNGSVQRLDEGGTVVGLFEEYAYEQRTLKVEPGSVLVAFSDGLTEPENAYGEEYGMGRLKDEILRQRNIPAQRMAEDLIAASEQWAGLAEQADDITVVVARMG